MLALTGPARRWEPKRLRRHRTIKKANRIVAVHATRLLRVLLVLTSLEVNR